VLDVASRTQNHPVAILHTSDPVRAKRSWLHHAALSAVLALCPVLAAAQGPVQTFTSRAAFRAAVAEQSGQSAIVNFRLPSISATDLGVADVSTTGSCITAPSFGTAGGGKWIDFNNGACGTGALTFTLNRGDVPGFGFFLGSVAIPGGRATFNVTTTFTGGVTGQSTASYQLGRGLGDGFFAVLLDPDQTTGIVTVTVSTNSAARIALRDVEVADVDQASVVTPEPATVSLLGAGLLSLGVAVRRRRRH
jgi:hypothetical protein